MSEQNTLSLDDSLLEMTSVLNIPPYSTILYSNLKVLVFKYLIVMSNYKNELEKDCMFV